LINLFSKQAFSFCSFIKGISINLINLYFKATIGANSCYIKGEELDEKRLDRAERNAKSRIYSGKLLAGARDFVVGEYTSNKKLPRKNIPFSTMWYLKMKNSFTVLYS
jgi:hypothetical protein